MNRKKAIITLGSPRKKGNSTLLAQKTAEGVQAAGGEYETLFLHEMSIHPCTACGSCQKDSSRYCIIDDDMKKLYPKILEAHALVIAGPVYWFTVSAQTKLFMDRCYAFQSPDGHALKGKRIGIILTYGDPDPFISGAVNALRTFQDSFHYIQAPIVGAVYGSALEAGEIASNQELMDRAFELGKQLME